MYEDDNIFWIVYPLEGTEEPVQPLGAEEEVTLMRFGSTGDTINYLFCPHYYCLYDEIIKNIENDLGISSSMFSPCTNIALSKEINAIKT